MPEPAQGNSVTNTFQAPFQLPAGATEVVLVRHGSVAFTGGGLAGGGADPPLTDTGRAQAHAVVHALVGTSFQGLVSSPLRRAVETAAPLAAATAISSVAFEELRGSTSRRVGDDALPTYRRARSRRRTALRRAALGRHSRRRIDAR